MTSRAPSWRPSERTMGYVASFGRWVAPIIVAIVGTGGCGVAALRVVEAATTTAEKVAAIEAKLDAWREEQHQQAARLSAAERNAERIESNVRSQDSRIDSLAKDVARAGVP